MIIQDYFESSDNWIYRLEYDFESKDMVIYRCVGEYSAEDRSTSDEGTWEKIEDSEAFFVLKQVVLSNKGFEDILYFGG